MPSLHLTASALARAWQVSRMALESWERRPRYSEILGAEASALGDACQHPWADFLGIVEGKHEIRPVGSSESAVRTGLAL
jgi:hypothetical protein